MMRSLIVVSCVVLSLAGCNDRERAATLAREGLTLARQGNTTAALASFEKALEVDPENLTARFNAGLAELAHHQSDHARAHFEKFLKLRPNDAQGHFELARAHALAGREEEALLGLHRAVEFGFADYGALTSGGVFQRLSADVRYLQLEALVAQRAGIPDSTPEAFGRQGIHAYGGIPIANARLPRGFGNDGGACNAPEPIVPASRTPNP